MSKRPRASAPDIRRGLRRSEAVIVVVPKWALLRGLITTALVTSVIVALRTSVRPRSSAER